MLFKSFTAAALATVALMSVAGAANAGITTFTSSSAFNAAGAGISGSVPDQVDWGVFDDTLNQQHDNGSIYDGASMTTAAGETITANSGDGNAFTTYVQGGAVWKGDFPSNATILFTGDGAITLSFASPLIGLGVEAQIFRMGAYNITLKAYSTLCDPQDVASCTNSGSGYLGSITNSGTSSGTNNAHPGTAPFVGIMTDAQNNTSSLNTNGISFVVISSGGANTGSGFAIDTSLLYHYATGNNPAPPSNTPEPGTLALLGVGLAALGAIRRRRSTN
jgi:hypothetical protein